MKDMILAAVQAAVATTSEKPENVNEDIVTHLMDTVLNNEEVNASAGKFKEIITSLGNQFEKMSLTESRLIGYLLEALDLPRGNLQAEGIADLAYLSEQAEANPEDEVTIVPSKLGLSTLPNSGVVVQNEDGEESSIKQTLVYIKLSKSKMMLFCLTSGLVAYSVTKAGDNLLVEKKPGYSHNDLGQSLQAIIDTEFAPKLMSDRETVPVDGLDTDWLEAYVNDNPDVMEGLVAGDTHRLLDKVVGAYAKINDIVTEGKRLELEHHDKLLEMANGLLETKSADSDSAVEASLTAHETIDDVEVLPVDEDAPLFSEGVVEQPVETATPVVTAEEDLFASDESIEEVVIEEDVFDTTKNTTEIAVDILNKLGDDPARGLSVIQNSGISIKDSLYREVFNTLPSIEKRSSASYTDELRVEISDALDVHYRNVLSKIETYRLSIEKERVEALPYKTEMVEKAITDSPVHSSLIEGTEKRHELAESIARYLNDNDPDSGTKVENTINEVLRNLSLFGYESESLINSTYRATNVPAKESMIRNTPVISTTLRKLYTQNNGWVKDKSDVLKDAFDEVNSGARSGLDLNQDTVDILIDGTLKEKQFTRVGGYIVVSAPVKSPEKSKCVIVMTSSQARIFNIDRETKRVVGLVDISSPSQRNDLLTILMNN